MKKINLKKLKNSCGSTQNLARFVVQRKQGESNAHESSLRENERSEFSWQSKSRESNKNIESMTQERIKKIHKFAQSKQIVGDSRIAKIDSSLTAFAQNDDRIINCIDSQCVSESCGSILSGFRGLCSHEQENKTDCLLTKRVANSREIHQKTNARAGFGMMFAIIITILVATLGVLAIRFSTQTLNTTTNEYIAIQLDLYLNSTTELAILYVQRNGFVCKENAANCDLGEASLTNPNLANRRADATAPIEKYIKYGSNGEYSFKYKMTPLGNYDGYNPNFYPAQPDEYGTCDDTRCFKEETKNAFILDIAGSVTNPTTNQTLRVTKRQIIKP